MRPRARWLLLIVLGTLVFVTGTWLFLATWDAPASDLNLLATGLAGAGLLTIVVGTVGTVASGLGTGSGGRGGGDADQTRPTRSNAD